MKCVRLCVPHIAAGLRLAAVTLHDVLEGVGLLGDLPAEGLGSALGPASQEEESVLLLTVRLTLEMM